MLHEIDGNTMKHSIPMFPRKNCDGKETIIYVVSIGDDNWLLSKNHDRIL